MNVKFFSMVQYEILNPPLSHFFASFLKEAWALCQLERALQVKWWALNCVSICLQGWSIESSGCYVPSDATHREAQCISVASGGCRQFQCSFQFSIVSLRMIVWCRIKVYLFTEASTRHQPSNTGLSSCLASAFQLVETRHVATNIHPNPFQIKMWSGNRPRGCWVMF